MWQRLIQTYVEAHQEAAYAELVKTRQSGEAYTAATDSLVLGILARLKSEGLTALGEMLFPGYTLRPGL